MQTSTDRAVRGKVSGLGGRDGGSLTCVTAVKKLRELLVKLKPFPVSKELWSVRRLTARTPLSNCC